MSRGNVAYIMVNSLFGNVGQLGANIQGDVLVMAPSGEVIYYQPLGVATPIGPSDTGFSVHEGLADSIRTTMGDPDLDVRFVGGA